MNGEIIIRYLETDFVEEDMPIKDQLRKDGRYIYCLRDWLTGNGYNIEKWAVVNRIGYMVTDTDLTKYMHDGTWIRNDELYSLKSIKWVTDETLVIPSIPVERLDLSVERAMRETQFKKLIELQDLALPIERRYHENKYYSFSKNRFYKGICIQYVNLMNCEDKEQTVGYFTENNLHSRQIVTKRNLRFQKLINLIEKQEASCITRVS